MHSEIAPIFLKFSGLLREFESSVFLFFPRMVSFSIKWDDKKRQIVIMKV